MAGGIRAWNGQQVLGAADAGLELLTGVEDYPDAVALAFVMEDSLQKFYQRLYDSASSGEQQNLLKRLAGFEEFHKANLRDEYQKRGGGDIEELVRDDARAGVVMEGGENVDALLSRVQPQLTGTEEILNFAMMLEAEAFDLYIRMAQKSGQKSTRDLFLKLADEETMHLEYLSRELEKIL